MPTPRRIKITETAASASANRPQHEQQAQIDSQSAAVQQKLQSQNIHGLNKTDMVTAAGAFGSAASNIGEEMPSESTIRAANANSDNERPQRSQYVNGLKRTYDDAVAAVEVFENGASIVDKRMPSTNRAVIPKVNGQKNQLIRQASAYSENNLRPSSVALSNRRTHGEVQASNHTRQNYVAPAQNRPNHSAGNLQRSPNALNPQSRGLVPPANHTQQNDASHQNRPSYGQCHSNQHSRQSSDRIAEPQKMAATLNAQTRMQRAEVNGRIVNQQHHRNDDAVLQSIHEQWQQEDQSQRRAPHPIHHPPLNHHPHVQHHPYPGAPHYPPPPPPPPHPPQYYPYQQPDRAHHNPNGIWQCKKCFRTNSASVKSCICTSQSPSGTWKCNKCSRANSVSVTTCACNSAAAEYQPQRSTASDFQPPMLRPNQRSVATSPYNVATNHQERKQHHPKHRYPEHYTPPTAASPGEPRYRTKKIAQKMLRRPDEDEAVDLTVDDSDTSSTDEARRVKPNNSNNQVKMPKNQNGAHSPPRGKQANFLERLRLQPNDAGEVRGSQNNSAKQTNRAHGDLNHTRNERSRISLNKAIDNAESLPQLEAIRHHVKILLEKVEGKINRALVRKALDEYGKSDEQGGSSLDDMRRNVCCPLCFSFNEISGASTPVQQSCPSCERLDLCPSCRSNCRDCRRSCCIDCILQCEFCQCQLCPDCKCTSSIGAEKSATRRELCQRCDASVANVGVQNAKKRKNSGNTNTDGRPFINDGRNEKRMKSSAAASRSVQTVATREGDGINRASKKPSATNVRDGETSAASKTPGENGGNDTLSTESPIEPAAALPKSTATGSNSNTAVSNSSDSTPQASYFVKHLFTVIHEGSLGICIGPDPRDRSNAIVTKVDKGKHGDIYGLKVGDRIFDPNPENTEHKTTKAWLIQLLKSRPASFSVLRECNSEELPIYALGVNGDKHTLSFDGDVRASIHRFVFNSSDPLGIVVGERSTSKYSYTHVVRVEPGSLAAQQGLLVGDIISQLTPDGRLISGLEEWITALITVKSLYRFEVVRIHRLSSSDRTPSEVASPIDRTRHYHQTRLVDKQNDHQYEAAPQEEKKDEIELSSEPLLSPQTNGESQHQPKVLSREKSNKSTDVGTITAVRLTLQDGSGREKNRTPKDNKNNDSYQLKDDTMQIHEQPPISNLNEPLYSIGTKVQRKFFDEQIGKERYFKGEIKSYDSPFYKVVYEDGDEEERDENEVAKMVEKHKKRESKKQLKKLPLLVGTLWHNEQDGLRTFNIQGHWHFENQGEMASQTFELTRTEDTSKPVTLNGEFSGSFVHELKDPKTKEVTLRTIKESRVILEFIQKDTKDSNTFVVTGKGINQYGVFKLDGDVSLDKGSNANIYNVRMYKKYTQSI